MKLIKITGDTKLIVYEKTHNYWEYTHSNKPFAVIEAHYNGCEDGCSFQSYYRIYRNKKGKLYCNVRKERVYLEELGYKEND